MKLSYPKIQKIIDMIDDRVARLEEKTSIRIPAMQTLDGEDYYPEETKEKDFLREIKQDFMEEINKVNFVFEIQTGMGTPEHVMIKEEKAKPPEPPELKADKDTFTIGDSL